MQQPLIFDKYSEAEITIHESQAGYAPADHKEIVIWVRRPCHNGLFEVQERESHRPLFVGELRYGGVNVWGWHEWIADLTSFTQPGKYRFYVMAGSGYMAFVEPLVIEEELHANLAHKTAKHIFGKRSGIYQHDRDAWIRSDAQDHFGEPIRHVDVSGGWHDAGDDSKWSWLSTWPVIEGLCESWERLRPDWKGPNEKLPYPLAEAAWGVEWLLKMQQDDGSFYYAVVDIKKRFDPVKKRWHVLPWAYDGYHDYDPLTESPRWLIDQWGQGYANRLIGTEHLCPSLPHMYYAQLAATLARFARVVRDLDSELSGRAARAAKKTLGWLAQNPAEPVQHIYTQSGVAQACLELFRLEGGKELLAKAESHLEAVLALQDENGFFRAYEGGPCLESEPKRTEDRILSDYPFAYLLALIRYLQQVPDGRLASACRAALAKHVQLVKRLVARTGSFRVLPEWTLRPDGEVIMSSGHGYNAWFLVTATFCGYMAELLGDDELRVLAERHVQWVLGANPRAMSFMVGVGRRRTARQPLFVHSAGRLVQWGITNGMYGSGQATSDFGNSVFLGQQPPNYPNAGLSEEGGYDARAEEPWLNVTGWFHWANAVLAARSDGNAGAPQG